MEASLGVTHFRPEFPLGLRWLIVHIGCQTFGQMRFVRMAPPEQVGWVCSCGLVVAYDVGGIADMSIAKITIDGIQIREGLNKPEKHRASK